MAKAAAISVACDILARARFGDKANIGATKMMAKHAHRRALHIVSSGHGADKIEVARRRVGGLIVAAPRRDGHLKCGAAGAGG